MAATHQGARALFSTLFLLTGFFLPIHQAFAQDPGKPYIYFHTGYHTRTDIESDFVTNVTPHLMYVTHPYSNLVTPTPYMNNVLNVRLVYGKELFSDVKDKFWSYQIVFNVYDGNNVLLGNSTLTIDHFDDAQTSRYEQQFRLAVPYSATYKLEISQIKACSYTPPAACTLTAHPFAGVSLPSDIRVEFGLEIERMESLSAIAPASVSLGISNSNNESKAEFRWDYAEGAVSYEVEYVYWDKEGPALPSPLTDPAKVEELFKDAIRIETWKTWHEVDVLYPKGDVFFRVRGVGRHYTNTPSPVIYTDRKYTPWSAYKQLKIDVNFLPSGTPQEIPAFEQSRNWQYTTTFAEEGKSKKTVSYFDNSLRKRQVLSYLNDSRVVLVGETDYNIEGAPTLNILPVPALAVADKNMRFKSSFNRNAFASAYSYRDFDKTGGADPLDESVGAGWYFSYQHYNDATVSDIYKAYIPTAKKYPLSQITYLRDGTNRLASQSAVGDVYKLGSGQETKYFHTTVTKMELQRLFGLEVGNPKHYKKEYVQDANGQISVSYMDMADRVIATALVGDAPSNVDALGRQATIPVTQSLMDNNSIIPDEKSESISQVFNPLPSNVFNFTYNLTGLYDQINFPNSTSYCEGCSYTLEIEIFGPDGTPVNVTYNGNSVPKVSVTYQSPTPNQVGTCAASIYPTTDVTFTATFAAIGTYEVHKILRVKQRDIDLVQTELQNAGIFPDLQALITQYTTNPSLDDGQCDIDCSPTCDPAILDSAIVRSAVAECESMLGQMKAQIGPNALPGGAPAVVTWDMAIPPANSHFDSIRQLPILVYDQNGKLYKWKYTPPSNYSWVEMVDPNTETNPNITATSITIRNTSGATQTIIANDPGTGQGPRLLYSLMRYPTPAPQQATHSGYWQDQWADAVVFTHREYCHYFKCKLLKASREFDIKLAKFTDYTSISSFLSIDSSCFIYPTGGPSGNVQQLKNALFSQDPFFAVMNKDTNSTCTATLAAQVSDYFVKYPITNNINTTAPSCPCNTLGSGSLGFVDTSTIMRYVNAVVTSAQPNYPGIPGSPNPSGGVPGFSEKQKELRLFLALYGTLKNRILESCKKCNWYDNENNEDDNYAVVKRVPNDGTTMDTPGEVYSYINAQIGGSSSSTVLINSCTAGCEGKADYQLTQIEKYIQSCVPAFTWEPNYTIQRDTLRSLLIKHCVDDCNPMKNPICSSNNPAGASLQSTNHVPCSTADNLTVSTVIQRKIYNNTAPFSGCTNICPVNTIYTGTLGNEGLQGCLGETYIKINTSTSAPNGAVVRVNTSFCDGTGMIGPVIEVFQTTTCAGITSANQVGFYNLLNTGQSFQFYLPNANTTYYIRLMTHPAGKTGRIELAYIAKNTTTFPQINTIPPLNSNNDTAPLTKVYNNIKSLLTTLGCASPATYTQQATTLVTSSTNTMGVLEPCLDEMLKNVKSKINEAGTPATWSITKSQLLPSSASCFSGLAAPGSIAIELTAADNTTLFVYSMNGICFDNVTYQGLATSKIQIFDQSGHVIPWNIIEWIDNIHPVLEYLPISSPRQRRLIEASIGIGSQSYIAYINITFLDAGNYVSLFDNCVSTIQAPPGTAIFPSILETNCLGSLQAAATQEAMDNWQSQVDNIMSVYPASRTKCLNNPTEVFKCSFSIKEHQYTLFYYNQAGELIRTVPPLGVNPIPIANFPNGIWNGSGGPVHTMITEYRHNTLGQTVWKKSPDEGVPTDPLKPGVTTYYYDDLQRIRLSQNAQQKQDGGKYAYTKYDQQNRVIQIGEVTNYTTFNATDLYKADFPQATYTLTQKTTTTYDDRPGGLPGTVTTDNLRGRVASIANENIATYYFDYDAHGNVKTLWQYVPDLTTEYIEIKYFYDLISGKTNELRYRPGKKDQFYHKYFYDADNRLTEVFTSEDGYVWDCDARYFYYLHGPLARMEYGQDKVQGTDYTYTMQGWLKSLNLPGYTSYTFEPGKDGYNTAGNVNRYVSRDQMSLVLGYNSTDYIPTARDIVSPTFSLGALVDRGWQDFVSTDIKLAANGTTKGLYNGNIVLTISDIKKFTGSTENNIQALTHRYDALHRLLATNDYEYNQGLTKWAVQAPSTSTYGSIQSYDENGNIRTLNRRWNSANAGSLDSISYQYATSGATGHNRLLQAIETNGTDDLSVQDFVGNHTYTYDQNGNLLSDIDNTAAVDITSISWSVYGKVLSVTKNDGKNLVYKYDPYGNRLYKSMTVSTNPANIYIRDIQGNVLAVYEKNSSNVVTQIEASIYGSKRIGVRYFNSTERSNLPGSLPTLQTRLRGAKGYELTDHLGNVTVSMTDQRWGEPTTAGSWVAAWYSHSQSTNSIRSASDYYPFGFEMPGGRTFTPKPSRYGFNGKENDKDWGTTTIQDYGFRLYSPAIGKFLSVDPLREQYPWYTPYQFAGNTPIQAVDMDGLEPSSVVTVTSDGKYKFTEPAVQLLSWASGTDEVTIRNTIIVPRSKPFGAPWYSAKKGGGAMTSDEKIRYTRNYFKGWRRAKSAPGSYYGGEDLGAVASWLYLSAHETGHLSQAKAFNSDFAYYLSFAGEYITSFGHGGAPKEKDADLGLTKLARLIEFTKNVYGEHAFAEDYTDNKITEEEKLDKLCKYMTTFDECVSDGYECKTVKELEEEDKKKK